MWRSSEYLQKFKKFDSILTLRAISDPPKSRKRNREYLLHIVFTILIGISARKSDAGFVTTEIIIIKKDRDGDSSEISGEASVGASSEHYEKRNRTR